MECSYCGRELKKSKTCSFKSVRVNGVLYERKRFCTESDYDNQVICPDCGVKMGKFHHPGCIVEEFSDGRKMLDLIKDLDTDISFII